MGEKEAATRIEAAFKGRRARQDLHDKIMESGTEEQKAALLELEERRRRRETARLKKESALNDRRRRKKERNDRGAAVKKAVERKVRQGGDRNLTRTHWAKMNIN